MNNLAATLWQMDERRPALELMRRAAEGHRKVLGPDHPDSLHSPQAFEQMQADLPAP